MTLALAIIPQQLYLIKKSINLREEMANITAYVYEQKIMTGNFPNDLSGYTFSLPKLEKHTSYTKQYDRFSYPKKTEQAFELMYFVGPTSHSYNSENKRWSSWTY
jgi:hypothetical protein